MDQFPIEQGEKETKELKNGFHSLGDVRIGEAESEKAHFTMEKMDAVCLSKVQRGMEILSGLSPLLMSCAS